MLFAPELDASDSRRIVAEFQSRYINSSQGRNVARFEGQLMFHCWENRSL